jgi:hypothetical protein
MASPKGLSMDSLVDSLVGLPMGQQMQMGSMGLLMEPLMNKFIDISDAEYFVVSSLPTIYCL